MIVWEQGSCWDFCSFGSGRTLLARCRVFSIFQKTEHNLLKYKFETGYERNKLLLYLRSIWVSIFLNIHTCSSIIKQFSGLQTPKWKAFLGCTVTGHNVLTKKIILIIYSMHYNTCIITFMCSTKMRPFPDFSLLVRSVWYLIL